MQVDLYQYIEPYRKKGINVQVMNSTEGKELVATCGSESHFFALWFQDDNVAKDWLNLIESRDNEAHRQASMLCTAHSQNGTYKYFTSPNKIEGKELTKNNNKVQIRLFGNGDMVSIWPTDGTGKPSGNLTDPDDETISVMITSAMMLSDDTGPDEKHPIDSIFEENRGEGIDLSTKIEPQKYIIETIPGDSYGGYLEPMGVIPKGRVAMLAAEGGAGKSWVLTQLALAYASGGSWLKSFNACESGEVFLALGEEEPREVERRLQAAARLVDMGNDAFTRARSRIDAQALAGKVVNLVNENGPTAIWEKMHEYLSRRKFGLIILDPLSRFGGQLVETDAHFATKFISLLEGLTKLPGSPTVILAHHTNKVSRGGVKTHGAASRGTSALTDGVRWQANLEVREVMSACPHLVDFRVTKSNLGVIPPPVCLTRVSDLAGALRKASPDEMDQWIQRNLEEKQAAKGQNT